MYVRVLIDCCFFVGAQLFFLSLNCDWRVRVCMCFFFLWVREHSYVLWGGESDWEIKVRQGEESHTGEKVRL
jgi:hypothetical protein